RAVAVAVAVGLVGPAAGAPVARHRGVRAASAAGVDAIGTLVGGVHAEPAACVAAANAGAGFAHAVAADAGGKARRDRAAVAAGEDLDHPAQRLGAVQARARPAHDLDPVDLVHRQVVEHHQPGR